MNPITSPLMNAMQRMTGTIRQGVNRTSQQPVQQGMQPVQQGATPQAPQPTQQGGFNYQPANNPFAGRMNTRQSQEYLTKLSNFNPTPNLRQQIAKAYDDAVVRGVVNEGAQLQSQYLPTVFGTLERQGTGAADMSPAAKLNQIGGALNQLSARVGANNAIQNFYGTGLNDMVNQAQQNEEAQYGRLANMYNTSFGREQALNADALQRAQLGDQSGFRDKSFGYQQSQDALANEWKQRMFDYQKEQDALAAAERARSGGGGGYGGFGGLSSMYGDMPAQMTPEEAVIETQNTIVPRLQENLKRVDQEIARIMQQKDQLMSQSQSGLFGSLMSPEMKQKAIADINRRHAQLEQQRNGIQQMLAGGYKPTGSGIAQGVANTLQNAMGLVAGVTPQF